METQVEVGMQMKKEMEILVQIMGERYCVDGTVLFISLHIVSRHCNTENK